MREIKDSPVLDKASKDSTSHDSVDSDGRRAGLDSGFNFKKDQTIIVFGCTLIIFLILGVTLEGFFTLNNIFALVQSISMLGILGLGMAIVVIGRGIDISLLALAVATGIITLEINNAGYPLVVSLGTGVVVAIGFGVINGFLISIVEIPALFTTLATMQLFLGFAREAFTPSFVEYLSNDHNELIRLGGNIADFMPIPVLLFISTALLVHLFLSKTVLGRFIYAHGDNAGAGRLTGISVRTLTMIEYAIAGVIGYIAITLVSMPSTGLINTRMVLESNLIYFIVLVVVLGGVSLTGGRGGVMSVVAGALLVGVIGNAMTLMDLDRQVQDIILGVVMLVALIVDSYVNPRDEETAKQGD